MSCRVLKHQDLGIVIEYERGATFSRVIVREPFCTRVKRVRNTVLDKGLDLKWSYSKGPGEAAKRFLTPLLGANCLDEEAKLILERIMSIYLINTSTSRILGPFATDKDAERVAGENPAMVVVTNADDCEQKLTGKQMGEILTNLTGVPTSRVKDKGAFKEKLYTAICNTPKMEPRPVAAGRPAGGVKQRIRELLLEGNKYTADELVEKTQGTKVSVMTALSDLKSAKYSGKEGPLDIVRENGVYSVRQQPTA